MHLYLAQMEDFGAANVAYGHHFPAVSPPARACVQAQLPPGVDLTVDVLLAHGKLLNGAMSANISCSLNMTVASALHVLLTPSNAGLVRSEAIATRVYTETTCFSLAVMFRDKW